MVVIVLQTGPCGALLLPSNLHIVRRYSNFTVKKISYIHFKHKYMHTPVISI